MAMLAACAINAGSFGHMQAPTRFDLDPGRGKLVPPPQLVE